MNSRFTPQAMVKIISITGIIGGALGLVAATFGAWVLHPYIVTRIVHQLGTGVGHAEELFDTANDILFALSAYFIIVCSFLRSQKRLALYAFGIPGLLALIRGILAGTVAMQFGNPSYFVNIEFWFQIVWGASSLYLLKHRHLFT